MKSDLIQEIRINPKYTQYLLTEFPGPGAGSMKDEGKPIIVKRTLFTNDYMKKLSGHSDIGILPPNCRYIEQTNKGHVVLIEEPPALRTIKIHKGFESEVSQLKQENVLEKFGYKNFDASGGSSRTFSLAFPYVIFILLIEHDTHLVDGLVFLRTQEMRGMSDYLLKAPLLNISSNQKVCFGEANKFETHSLTQTIQNVIMVFWSAVFNTDYTYNYESYRKEESEFGNYLRWEYLTTQNPLFIYDAKWIEINGNIGHWLTKVKNDAHVIGEKSLTYSRAAEIIFAPGRTDMEALPTSRSRKKFPLFYDIANGIYVGEYFLSIGDPFTNSRGDVLYIDSFIGFQDGGKLKYVMVDKNGKKFMMKLTKKVKDYIAVSNKALRYSNEMVLPNNNLKVKTGDILIFTNKDGSEHYGSVDFIRVGRDGRAELKVGRDYYIAENINATKFEMEKPSVYNIELKEDEPYILIRDARGSSPMVCASKVNYKRVRVSSGSMKVEYEFVNTFRALRGVTHRLPMSTKGVTSSSGIRLFRESNVKPLPGLFRIGKKMYFISTNSDGTAIPRETLAWEVPGPALAYENNCALRRPRHGMISELVKNDTFKLPGFLLDLEFRVGDKVVTADWKNPHDILRVKEIAGFSIVERESRSTCEDLYFILSDKDGNLSKIRYIYGYLGLCNIGKIRKITNVFNRVSAGTKIIANESGYSGFPKKCVNIIVGFIIDTGGKDPLVLCSNGQTIWFDDMMKDFTRVTMRAKKWATLKHAPIDLSKIKPQPGDLINGTTNYKTSEGYFVTHLPDYRGVRAQYMEYYSGYPETRPMDSTFTREYIYECIPNPRIRRSQGDDLGMLPGYPNFHGVFHYSEKSNYHFINEPGRFINVPGSSK